MPLEFALIFENTDRIYDNLDPLSRQRRVQDLQDTGNHAPLTRDIQKLARGLLAVIAPVSIAQLRNSPLWLVSQTSLSFSDVTLSHLTNIDWRPGPWYILPTHIRRRQVSLGSMPTLLGRDMQKMIVVTVDAVDLLNTRCLVVSSDAFSVVLLPASTFLVPTRPFQFSSGPRSTLLELE